MTPCLVALLIIGCASRVDGDDDLEGRWRREYPAAADALEAVSRRFFAKGTLKGRYLHKTDVLITEEFTVAGSEGNQLFSRDKRFVERPGEPKNAVPSDVMCVTPTYGFALRKNSMTEPYFIEQFEAKLGNEVVFRIQYNVFAYAATMGRGMIERIKSRDFTIKSIRSAMGPDGANLVELAYRYKHPGNSPVVEEGSVFLDPDLGWALRKAAFIVTRKDSQSRYTWDVQYYIQDVGRYFPKRIEVFVRTDDPNNFHHELIEYSNIQLDNVPEDIFKLTAYGLPDVPLSPRLEPPFFSPANPIFWVLLATAVGSFILLRILRDKRSQAVEDVQRT